MRAFMEDMEMILLIQTPEFLAYLASEGMHCAMEIYNAHVWMSTVMQPPLSFSIPPLPFFHIPSWETLTLNVQQLPSPVATSMVAPTFPNFQDIDPLYQHLQMNEGNQGGVFADLTLGLTGQLMESPRTTFSNNLASLSQVLPNPNLVQPLRLLSTTTREIEKTLEVMRETRTKI
ncbi:hypothetical protein FXO38_18885 [Capsicum annuum]|nr:hypothetical protein FXO38_18885 [Capsicum annuum]